MPSTATLRIVPISGGAPREARGHLVATVEPGAYRLVASLAGYAQQSVKLEVRRGAKLARHLVLRRGSGSSGGTSDVSTGRSVLRYAGFGALIAGGLSLALAIWQGIEATSLSDDVQREADAGRWAPDVYDSANRSERASIALYVTAGVAVAAGVTMLYLGYRSTKSDKRASRSPRWQVGVGPASAVLRARF